MAGSSTKSKVVGIDLGTTFSCIAYFGGGEPRIFKAVDSEITIPSYVGFDDAGNISVGRAAKNNLMVQPINLTCDSKRMIGRKFADPVVQEHTCTKKWTFDVIDVNGYPNFKLFFPRDSNVPPGGRRDTYSPEEISAEILKCLKKTAEYRLDEQVVDAVVTVPAYFNSNQRSATMRAAEMAGLRVLSLLSEPVAAAMAYAFEVGFIKKETILVYDLGGGTLDITILTVQDNNTFVVKAHAGNTNLGGQDFTNEVMKYAVQYFKDHFKDWAKQMEKPSNKSFLWDQCELAKRMLSSSIVARIRYDCDIAVDLHRGEFDSMNKTSFESTLKSIENALRDASLEATQIDRVILTGGSTRIVKIRELVTEYFKGKHISTNIDPDECVAKGAAIYAAVLTGDPCPKLKNFILTDVTPLSLGVSTGLGDMTVVVARNTPIPLQGRLNAITHRDDQKSISFSIYTGERPVAKDNTYLGNIELKNITVAPRGEREFDLTFDLSRNGILTASLSEKGTENLCRMQIKAETQTSSIDVGSSLAAAEVNKVYDEAVRLKQNARKKFEDYVFEQKRTVQRDTQRSSDKKKAIIDKCAEMIKWVDETELAEISTYDAKRRELDSICRL